MAEKERKKKDSDLQKQPFEETGKNNRKSDTGKGDNATECDPLKEMEARLESAKIEASQLYDRFLRVSAEFENYKKRSSREMDELRKFANESLIKKMLPVVDNLERAILSISDDEEANNSLAEGVDMTLKEVLKVFETYNVKPIESLGEAFDPSFHQAVTQELTEDTEENIVLKELQKGYLIHDRLLRPAMVVVSRAKEKHDNNDK